MAYMKYILYKPKKSNIWKKKLRTYVPSPFPLGLLCLVNLQRKETRGRYGNTF